MPDNDKEIGKLQGQVESLIEDMKEIHELKKTVATLKERQYGILLIGGIAGAIIIAALKSVISFFTRG